MEGRGREGAAPRGTGETPGHPSRPWGPQRSQALSTRENPQCSPGGQEGLGRGPSGRLCWLGAPRGSQRPLGKAAQVGRPRPGDTRDQAPRASAGAGRPHAPSSFRNLLLCHRGPMVVEIGAHLSIRPAGSGSSCETGGGQGSPSAGARAPGAHGDESRRVQSGVAGSGRAFQWRSLLRDTRDEHPLPLGPRETSRPPSRTFWGLSALGSNPTGPIWASPEGTQRLNHKTGYPSGEGEQRGLEHGRNRGSQAPAWCRPDC